METGYDRKPPGARRYVVGMFSWHNDEFDLNQPYCEGG